MDGQALEAKARARRAIRPRLPFIGATMNKRAGHRGREPLQGVGRPRADGIVDAGNATHGLVSLPAPDKGLAVFFTGARRNAPRVTEVAPNAHSGFAE